MQKHKHKMILILLMMGVLFLVSCDTKEDEPIIEDTYTVVWTNDNGDILKTDREVAHGTMPSFDGDTPSKVGTDAVTYVFSGWSPTLSEVVEDITYVAQYTEVPNTFTVTWINYDNEILDTQTEVTYGTTPSYEGEVPSRTSNEQYTYTFSGWTPEVSEVTGDITYKAVFTENLNTYTITWLNHDGEVLETQTEVAYGTTPIYDGPVPTKLESATYTYHFTGWNPEIGEVRSDITYTATFGQKPKGEPVLGVDPMVSEDGKSIQYGFYPQSYVGDSELIASLNTLTTPESNGWYLYEGTYYTNITANTYMNEDYQFEDGTSIVSGDNYWFEVEPITWNILSQRDGTYYLVTDKILDAQAFYQSYDRRTIGDATIYANNYEHSDLRTWLNNYFYDVAFNLNATYIKETAVDHSASTTDNEDNPYAGGSTLDKVYLPSYQDYLNTDYGFDQNRDATSSTRVSQTTDYARAIGAWSNITNNPLKYNGSYWTRSATSMYDYTAWNVNSGGYLSTYAVDGINHGVRPSITIHFILNEFCTKH